MIIVENTKSTKVSEYFKSVENSLQIEQMFLQLEHKCQNIFLRIRKLFISICIYRSLH